MHERTFMASICEPSMVSALVPACKRRASVICLRRGGETVFSQLNDNLLMIRNYAKQTCGLFTRMAGKIAAMTFMQYVNFVNHRPIGQIKYSLI
jgi:hypothetical protein